MTVLFGRSDAPVSLATRRAETRFKTLFGEGMTLVEEVAAYLDGPGRIEARQLDRSLASSYAAESMRLTTRLMQIASWLLVQKAINEGDFDRAKGILEKNRVQVTSQGIASQASAFARLPEKLQDFTARSLRIQARILQHDADAKTPSRQPTVTDRVGVQNQFELLRRAYAGLR